MALNFSSSTLIHRRFSGFIVFKSVFPNLDAAETEHQIGGLRRLISVHLKEMTKWRVTMRLSSSFFCPHLSDLNDAYYERHLRSLLRFCFLRTIQWVKLARNRFQ